VPVVPPTRPRNKNLPSVLGSVIWDLARGTPASLTEVEKKLFAGMTPPPRVTGEQVIPRLSPFVVVSNHFETARVASWWGPFLMTELIEERRNRAVRQGDLPRRENARLKPGEQVDSSRIRWLMAREWWYPRGFGRLVKQPLTRMLFGRIARVYGFILVPPVLDGDLTRGEGVAGVRQALALTRGEHPSLVGLAPEGGTGPGGALKEPPSGVGLFLLMLSHGKIPLLPIGWYEDKRGGLTINFGAPFPLLVPERSDRRARDRAIVMQAMTAIGRLLPERLWGAYREEIVSRGGEVWREE
jgi:1-acyl-sn-glycerol-3-phosphate acyltransferase